LTVDVLQLRVHVGAGIRIRRAGILDTQLSLDVQVNFALDVADPNAAL